jgi:hemolysin III
VWGKSAAQHRYVGWRVAAYDQSVWRCRILLYIGMGWISLLLVPQVVLAVSLRPVLLLLVGSLLYTIGAVIYALRRPNPFPRFFGFHEIFHLFVIGGTVAIAVMIRVWVVPFPRG